MDEDEETPDVVVEVTTEHNESEPDPVVESGDTVVVVAPPAETGASDAEVDRAVETAVDIAAINGRIDDVWDAIYELQAGQYAAQAVAEDAVVVAESVEDEVIDIKDEIASEIEPDSAKTHPFFRPLSEWRNK